MVYWSSPTFFLKAEGKIETITLISQRMTRIRMTEIIEMTRMTETEMTDLIKTKMTEIEMIETIETTRLIEIITEMTDETISETMHQ